MVEFSCPMKIMSFKSREKRRRRRRSRSWKRICSKFRRKFNKSRNFLNIRSSATRRSEEPCRRLSKSTTTCKTRRTSSSKSSATNARRPLKIKQNFRPSSTEPARRSKTVWIILKRSASGNRLTRLYVF